MPGWGKEIPMILGLAKDRPMGVKARGNLLHLGLENKDNLNMNQVRKEEKKQACETGLMR